jgi:hypothetical protein
MGAGLDIHGRYLGDIQPANMPIGAASVIGGYEIEIEAEAVVELQ